MVKNVNKLNEIINGWKNLIIKDDSVEKIAIERMSICVDCKHLTKRDICDICGCYMLAKTRSLTSKCEDNPSKW
jgi:recombinational DNA repair protein RecR